MLVVSLGLRGSGGRESITTTEQSSPWVLGSGSHRLSHIQIEVCLAKSRVHRTDGRNLPVPLSLSERLGRLLLIDVGDSRNAVLDDTGVRVDLVRADGATLLRGLHHSLFLLAVVHRVETRFFILLLLLLRLRSILDYLRFPSINLASETLSLGLLHSPFLLHGLFFLGELDQSFVDLKSL